MQSTVPETQLLLPLQKLSDDDEGDSLHRRKGGTLLEVDLESQLDEIDVLAVEEVLEQTAQVFSYQFDVGQVALGGGIPAWLFLLEVDQALEVHK